MVQRVALWCSDRKSFRSPARLRSVGTGCNSEPLGAIRRSHVVVVTMITRSKKQVLVLVHECMTRMFHCRKASRGSPSAQQSTW